MQEAASSDGTVSMRFVVINSSPMVTSYQTSKKYNYAELQQTVSTNTCMHKYMHLYRFLPAGILCVMLQCAAVSFHECISTKLKSVRFAR